MTDTTEPGAHPGVFRVGFVPGVTLTKWSRVWEERRPDLPLHVFHVGPADATRALAEAEADVVFARLPVDTAGLSAIPLYDEIAVVVVAKDHALAERAEVALADLEGETRYDLDASLTLPAAVEIVETGSGCAVMPASLARLYTRKGVTARPVVDLPATTIALVWPEDATTDDVNDFIGVVRGRTANSTRDRRESAPEGKAAPRREAKRPEQKKTLRTGTRGAPRGRGRGRGR